MSQLNVVNLTFNYEGSFDNIFENVSFQIDTKWKLGFIGRNGKGKTTFLNLLLGKLEYKGTISTDAIFDYFPYKVSKDEIKLPAIELLDIWKPGTESWRVMCELDALSIDAELLYRPFETLSFGEKTKVMLAVLFSGENDFLLIDEPTNHLDKNAREIIKNYLKSKKGFILVSHDRDLLDAVIDHVLVLNRETIEVQKGNFSSWWDNKQKADMFAESENAKHIKEIDKLKTSADRAERWADKSENSKIGFDPKKEPERNISTRSYLGAKSKKMQARVTNIEKRIGWEIEEKEGLLKDVEKTIDLKLMPMEHYKKRLICASDLSIKYIDANTPLFEGFRMEVNQGDIAFLDGENGCGKSSLIKAILGENTDRMTVSGTLEVAPNLVVSYINQDTSFLKGSLKDFAEKGNLDYSIFLSVLRQLDLEKVQFEKNMEEYSEGQKKKVLIASSLVTSAHLYIWDEPLNYIDVFSRMQIEKLIEKFRPTMLIVEHDVRFREKLATKVFEM